MSAQSRYIRIRGVRWRLVLGRPPANLCDGYCDYNTHTIYIRSTCGDVRASAIHEILHACLPDIEEEAIEEVEAALVSVLELVG